jgi:hypothetical protein
MLEANWDPIQVLIAILTHVNYVVLKIILEELVQYIHICNKNCAKCGGGQRVRNYGFSCPFYNGFGHAEDMHRKKRDLKGLIFVANYSEILVNNEETTLAKLN